ncbi:MAG: FAD assembly factor SdhE [Hyphomicrobium sp.]
MIDTTESRRRRAAWRAGHRGTKELDLMIGRFAEARLATMDERQLSAFEALLVAEEPDLQRWLLAPDMPTDAAFSGLVSDIRRFHGLSSS